MAKKKKKKSSLFLIPSLIVQVDRKLVTRIPRKHYNSKQMDVGIGTLGLTSHPSAFGVCDAKH
jgi:hypothetical protein